MMDDQNGQVPVQADEEQTVPAASPAPESVEPEKTDGDAEAVA